MGNQEALRVVVFKDEEKFVAQCVEFDICTQAADMDTLKARMDCLIERELREASDSGQPIDPSPERFHKMWDQGSHAYKEVAA